MPGCLSELEHRIRCLELSRRHWQRRAGLLLLGAIGVLALGAVRQAPHVTDELRTRKLVVVDEKDTPRIEIGQDPKDTQRISRSCGIVIRDKSGAERFGVGVMDNDTVNMGFDSAVGVGDPMRDRLALGVSPRGEPYVMLINNRTEVPVRLVASDEGGGVEFIDYDRANSKVIIRRISFSDDKKTEMHHDFPPEKK